MKYDNIINHNYVMKHKRMSNGERSFQFAPFSALVGFNSLIKERERETTKEREISEEDKALLDSKLQIINNIILSRPKIVLTHFIKDKTKSGGSYQKTTDYIKKIDFYHKLICLENGDKIKIQNIVNIDCLDIDLNEFLS